MLRWGRLDPGVYRTPDFDDPVLRELERKVVIHSEPDWADTRAARLEVSDRAGRATDVTVSAVRGDASMPWSEADLVGKFLDYCEPSITRTAAEALAERVLRAPLYTEVFPAG